MIFRKKKNDDPGELRQHYRRKPNKKHALAVKLRFEKGPPVAGELLDVSAGGAAVGFSKESAPELDPGDPAQLSFTSLVHGGEVLAKAVVASSARHQFGRRYGFAFTDPEGLFAQLDAYYLKFFNRRRAVRVRPDLNVALKAELAFGSSSMDVKINDISYDGFGVMLVPEKAGQLVEIKEVVVSLIVPKSKVPIRWPARTAHLTMLRHGGVLYGAAFQPANQKELDALQVYVEAREADMARWDTG